MRCVLAQVGNDLDPEAPSDAVRHGLSQLCAEEQVLAAADIDRIHPTATDHRRGGER